MLRKLLAAPSITSKENVVLAPPVSEEVKAEQEEIIDFVEEIKHTKFVSKNAGWRRLATYYKPISATVFMMFGSFL